MGNEVISVISQCNSSSVSGSSGIVSIEVKVQFSTFKLGGR